MQGSGLVNHQEAERSWTLAHCLIDHFNLSIRMRLRQGKSREENQEKEANEDDAPAKAHSFVQGAGSPRSAADLAVEIRQSGTPALSKCDENIKFMLLTQASARSPTTGCQTHARESPKASQRRRPMEFKSLSLTESASQKIITGA